MDNKSEIKNRKYLQVLEQLTKNEGYNNVCFHGGIECSTKIINAHTIQEERYLRRICNNGKVKCLRFENFKPVFTEVGLANATTFKGFCSYHDNILFKPIEEYDYNLDNIEQEFLFVYRALAKKHYELRKNYYHYSALKRMYETEDLKEITEVLELEYTDRSHICKKLINFILPHLNATKYELKIVEQLRQSLTVRLDNKQYDAVNTCKVVLNHAYGIVCSDYMYLDNDNNGKIINTRKCKDPLYPSFVTIIPQENKTLILISNLKRHERIFRQLVSYVKGLAEDELKILFSNIIIKTCETVCFSPILWNEYGGEAQKYFMKVLQQDDKHAGLVSVLDPKINLFKC